MGVVVHEPQRASDRPACPVDLKLRPVVATQVLVVRMDDRAQVTWIDERADRSGIAARDLAGPTGLRPKDEEGSPISARIASR